MFYSKLAWQNLKNGRQYYLPYLFANTFTVATFFTMVDFVFTDSLAESPGGSSTVTIMWMGAVVVGVFAVVFLFYSNGFIVKRRRREFGLYNVLGMEKRHISKVLLLETLYTYLATTVCGVAVGILLFKLLHLLLCRLMSYDVPLGFEFHVEPILVTLALFLGISMAVYLNGVRQVYVSNPIELLKSGSVGEREPRSNWVLAILGVVSLGTGYYMALTASNSYQAIEEFFVAVLCVVVGTYLLFTAGSIVVLKALRRNKGFYYRPNHYTVVSGMLYRMKQNAVGLGNIAILSTMTVVAVSGSVSLYCGVGSILDERYPNDIEVTYYSDYVYSEDAIPSRSELYQTVQDTLDEYGRTASDFEQYETLSVTVTQTDGGVLVTNPEAVETLSYLPDTLSILALLTLDDYNALTGEDRTLKSGEVLAYAKGYDLSETFSVDGTEYSVTRLDGFPIDTGYYDVTGVSEVYVVFSDYAQLEAVYRKQLQEYESPSRLEYVVSFSLDGTDDEKLAFSDALGERLKLPVDGKDYYINPVVSKQSAKDSFYSLYGGILFIGLFLGVTFLMATCLIVYYKQLSEGYEDRARFQTMQKVGLSRSEAKKTVRTQVLMVFFLPLVTAFVHTAFAFPMVTYLLKAFALTDTRLFTVCTVACILAFTVVYVLVYSATARVYYRVTTR